ncbi:hypothetical protein [Rubinisphaera margarita]|uniref:hypothetical protein n=1 Tax=Rubinisphaera margarita TaxID=2909586 RepID=UPI001EE98102|nr:hypothetical protein [Rubinisphaera margarita]MCG6154656.1 hypothetical protein [Rubinisphaera margarita]
METYFLNRKGLAVAILLSFAVGSCFHGVRVTLCVAVLLIAIYAVFRGIDSLVRDRITAFFLTTLTFLLVTFLPADLRIWVSLGLTLGCSVAAVRWPGDPTEGGPHDLPFGFRFLDGAMWVILFVLVSLAGVSLPTGYLVHDSFHPLYELSIGHSYRTDLLNPPDLSYAGAELHFHFLSTQINSAISDLLQIPVLEAVYFATPACFCFLFLLLLDSFSGTYPTLRAPILIIWFLPLFWETGAHFNLFDRSLLATPSYALAHLFLLGGVHFLQTRQRSAILLTSIVLLLTKASFFLVFFGAVFLLTCREFNRKNLSLFIAIGISFALLYKLFLSGAHAHNHWFMFPYGLFVSFENEVLGSVPFLFLLSLFAAYFFAVKPNDVRFPVAGVALSGFLGCFILTEATESNHTQFVVATSVASALVIWNVASHILVRRDRAIGICTIAMLLLLCGLSVVQAMRPAIGLAGRVALSRSGDLNANLPHDLIETYSWLREHTPPDSIVLFGKHYEEWGTCMARSALSGRVMYIENTKYKGVGMLPTYGQRMAENIHFYASYVNLSPSSLERIDAFYAEGFGTVSGTPFSKRRDIRGRIKYWLGFGKDWSWLSRVPQLEYEVREALENFETTDLWLQQFLESSGTNFIVLENGDQPTKTLLSRTTAVYQTESTTILRTRTEL